MKNSTRMIKIYVGLLQAKNLGSGFFPGITCSKLRTPQNCQLNKCQRNERNLIFWPICSKNVMFDYTIQIVTRPKSEEWLITINCLTIKINIEINHLKKRKLIRFRSKFEWINSRGINRIWRKTIVQGFPIFLFLLRYQENQN